MIQRSQKVHNSQSGTKLKLVSFRATEKFQNAWKRCAKALGISYTQFAISSIQARVDHERAEKLKSPKVAKKVKKPGKKR